MKNTIKYFRFIALGLLLAPFVFTTSCIKDYGNYTYVNIEGIQIDTIGLVGTDTVGYSLIDPIFRNAQIGETLRYKPFVIYSKDASQLEFAWFIYDYHYRPVQSGATMINPPADTVSRTHDLNWLVDADPGEYSLWLMVTDPETGIIGTRRYNLRIPSPGSRRGLYILTEYNGMSDIALYGSPSVPSWIMGGDHFTENYYSGLHGEMIPGAPRFIAVGGNWSNVYYYAFTEQAGLRINQDGMQVMDDFNTMFYSVPNFNPQAEIVANWNCDYLINDGKLHVLYTDKAHDRKFSAPIAGTYHATSYLQVSTRADYGAVTGAINADQIIFDELTNSFRPYYARAATLSRFGSTAPDAILDANNLGSKPIAILEMDGRTACIMRNGGRDSLYVFNFYNVVDDGDLSALGSTSRQNLGGCEGISGAKFFTSFSGLGSSAFFYATDKKVYGYSITSGQSSSNDIYECSTGEEITCICLLNIDGLPQGGRIFWIGVWNESTGKGKLVELEVDPVSGRLDTRETDGSTHITEFSGKIKSMVITF